MSGATPHAESECESAVAAAADEKRPPTSPTSPGDVCKGCGDAEMPGPGLYCPDCLEAAS